MKSGWYCIILNVHARRGIAVMLGALPTEAPLRLVDTMTSRGLGGSCWRQRNNWAPPVCDCPYCPPHRALHALCSDRGRLSRRPLRAFESLAATAAGWPLPATAASLTARSLQISYSTAVAIMTWWLRL